MTPPYLSIIITARNDDHGGNFLTRLQIFVDSLIEQTNRFGLNSELIIVEWNPPRHNLKLAKVLIWPTENKFCKIRIIEVPPKIHRRYKHSKNLPLFQMVAKNVGVRRSKGQYILVTNADIVFSSELIKFFSRRKLDAKYMYRIDRSDVRCPLNSDYTLEELIKYFQKNIVRIYKRNGTVYKDKPNEYLSIKSLLSFYIKAKGIIKKDSSPILHTNASGDFTLMAKKVWWKLRGYPEFEMFSWKIDTLFCYTAFFSGTIEKVLKPPYKIFHMEHKIDSEWSPEIGFKKMFEKFHKLGVPVMTSRECYALVKKMKKMNKHIIFNSKNWGLSEESLVETPII